MVESAASPFCFTSAEEHWLACFKSHIFNNTAVTTPARIPSNRKECTKR
jgi:hypothetical protein